MQVFWLSLSAPKNFDKILCINLALQYRAF